MNLASLAAVALLGPMLAVSIVNFLSVPRMRRRSPAAGPQRRVSLLVPARDEADNLRENLPGYLASDYGNLEVVVLDDFSTDGTAQVVESFGPEEIDAGGYGGPLDSHAIRTARFGPIAEHQPKEVEGPARGSEMPSLRLIRGRPLPSGWLGKPWACDQLAAAATGDILIFCDADVAISPSAVAATVTAIVDHGADVLTAFPRHRFDSWLTSAVVPIIAHLPISALLPLSLVSRSRSPFLAVGNGQWIAFTRTAYERCGGHRTVRDRVLEDVELARAAKRASLRLVPILASDLLSVRMYRTARSMVEGFSKNLFQIAGGTAVTFAASLAGFLLVGVYPLIGALVGHQVAILALGLLAANRVLAAWTFGHGLRSVVLHPVGVLVTLWIGARSLVGARSGTLVWKGRTLPAKPTG